MSQQTGPFVEAKWGWNYGESNWNTGADENWLKFSYLFDGNVDGIVTSIPTSAVTGTAFYFTPENRIYFVVAGVYYSTPIPKWFQFKLRSDGTTYQFDGTSAIQVLSPANITSAINAKEPIIAPGTALQYYRGDKTFQLLNKAAVGLANVDNTSDVNKPISTPTQTALNLKANQADLVTTNNNVTTKANKGANSDITSLTGLTTPLSLNQGGTGGNTAPLARTSLGLGNAAIKNTRAIDAEVLTPATMDDGVTWGYLTPQNSANGNGNKLNYYSLNISDDRAVQQQGVNGATGSKVQGFGVKHIFGGPTARGGRHAIDGTLLQGFGGGGITDSNNQDRFYVGVQGQTLSETGDGGTGALDTRGNYFGSSSFGGVLGGGWVNNLTGAEFNTQINAGVGAYAGNMVRIHTGLQVASSIGERGFGFDCALSVSNLGGSAKAWKDGLAFHGLNGAPALASDSTVIHIYPSGSATAAIDTVIDITGVTTAAIIRSTQLTLTDLGINYNVSNPFFNMGGSAANTPRTTFRSSGLNATYDARWTYSGGTATAGNGVVTLEANGLITPLIRPGVDNTMSLGLSNFRWSVVYAGTGTINTSDATEKTEVVPFSKDEMNAAKTLAKEIGTFKWLESVQAKGEDARKHIGLTVQRAIEVMEANNLDPMAYGFICYDEWDATEAITSENEEGEVEILQPATEAGSRYGFRMDQLNLFIAAGFEARLAALEDK